MKSRRSLSRILALFLALTLLLGLIPTAFAAETSKQISFEKVESTLSSADLMLPEAQSEDTVTTTLSTESDPDEMVRVSIVMEKQPVLSSYSVNSISSSSRGARSYRESLLENQYEVQSLIEEATGEELDVVWNLTLATNVISANVRRGDLDKIAETWGVAQVVEETLYYPCETEVGTLVPNMTTATTMTGADLAWDGGYTGAGSRVAIIDTGLDTDHQSLNNDAFLHALAEDAKVAGKNEEEYITSLNLLDVQELKEKVSQLNISKGYRLITGGDPIERKYSVDAEKLFVSDKIPFAFNYYYGTYDVGHTASDDYATGHGSHVAGIAAANRFLKQGNEFVDASETAHMVGTAPDAQILAMRVFSKNGGCADSDYMAAIEDAIVLGCDVINLSLGSTWPGFTENVLYPNAFDTFAEKGVVLSISAGNSFAWPEYSAPEYLYAKDVSFDTVGSPGSYANAFTVASVNNCGTTAPTFAVDGTDYAYGENQQESYNELLSTLDTSTDGSGTEYEYIFMDGVGDEDTYDEACYSVEDWNLFDGKIVFVARGGGMDFSEKHENAECYGAAACIIYNNEPGSAMNMNLSTSYAEIPCVSITQANAAAIRAVSAPLMDAEDYEMEGFYTGTLTVKASVSTIKDESGIYTMSQFSSWGVPGDLSLKPEITAPGGNIYSIDGETNATDHYISMGGTSMAAPHVAGLTAILTQYIREKGLADKLNISPRVLAQSLLMSTAEPVMEGENPYSLLKQGAGLANVNNAINASSYVTVENQPDGKVKAELYDDPDRTGIYTFSFTLHNMTDVEQQYVLDADVYTQNYFEGPKDYHHPEGEKTWYMDYSMKPMAANTTFSVGDTAIKTQGQELKKYDFNNDGYVNKADGQALVDFAVGKLDTLSNQGNADLSGDGKITSYDAELFLSLLGKSTVSLPASGEVTVTVTITLPETVKNELDNVFTNGTYIEAYVKAEAQSDAEGIKPAAHSIPVLAFYGSWDDPSMFDSYTHTELMHGTNEYASYIPSGLFNDSDYNNVVMTFGDTPGLNAFLGGNRFAKDEEYLPQRNAIRSNAGDAIVWMNYCLIRNAPLVRGSITNADTGKIYGEEYTSACAAHLNPNTGGWDDAWWMILPGAQDDEYWYITDGYGKNAEPLPEGTTVNLTVQATPDYYMKHYDYDTPETMVDWGALNPKSTSMTLPVTVDNTAPTLKEVRVVSSTDVTAGIKRNYIDVVAQDNEYIAAILLTNQNGEKVFLRQSPNQKVKGEAQTVRLDITDIFGDTFKLVVVDYAANSTEYDINLGNQFSHPTAKLIGATNDYRSAAWHEFGSDSNFNCTNLLSTKQDIAGATYGGGYVFYIGKDAGDDYENYSLYAADYPSFSDPIKIAEMTFSYKISDLAYNTDDGFLYYARGYDVSTLYRLDVTTGEVAEVAQLPAGDLGMYEVSGLAYHSSEHCFYATASIYNGGGPGVHSAGLFKFSLPEESAEEINMVRVADFGNWQTQNHSLVLDETQNVAFIRRSGNQDNTIFTYEFGSGAMVATGMVEPHSNLLLVGSDENTITSKEPAFVTISPESMSLFVGETKALHAEAGPWCLENKAVTWSSENPSVATVDQTGNITGKEAGTAVITAASVLDETVKAEITVTVIGNSFTFQGVRTNQSGESQFFTFNLGANALTPGMAVTDKDKKSIDATAAAEGENGTVWVRDGSDGCGMHEINPETGTSVFDSVPVEGGSPYLTDIAFDQYDYNTPILLGVDGKNSLLYFCEDCGSNSFASPFNMNNFDFDVGTLAALTKSVKNTQGIYTNVGFYALDVENKQIVRMGLSYTYIAGWGISAIATPLNANIDFVTGTDGHYHESMVYDAVTGTPILFHYTEDCMEIYALSLDQVAEAYTVTLLGKMSHEGYKDVDIYSASFDGTVAGNIAETQFFTDLRTENASSAVEDSLMQEDGYMRNSGHQGSLNAAVSAEMPDEDVVIVTVRADQPAKSGMMSITLGDGLTLKSVTSPALLSAYKLDGNKLTFGYAGVNDIKDGEVVASLTLAREGTENTTVTVTEIERSGANLTDTNSVTIPGTGKPVVYYTVTFMDGTEILRESEVENAQTVEPFVPTKTGYTFKGWYTDESSTIPYNFKTPVTEDLTLYARWNSNPYEPIPVPKPVKPNVSDGSENSATFVDVLKTHWAFDAVEFVAGNGWFNGVDTSHFDPNGKLTRAMLVTVLWRMEGKPEAAYAGTFDDVPAGQWYTTAVEWAAANGVVNGTGSGFDPNGYVTREQIATILWRLEGKPTVSGGLSTYPDGTQVSDYAKDAMIWAVKTGLFKGDAQGNLNPRATATRAEAATLLQRFSA